MNEEEIYQEALEVKEWLISYNLRGVKFEVWENEMPGEDVTLWVVCQKESDWMDYTPAMTNDQFIRFGKSKGFEK